MSKGILKIFHLEDGDIEFIGDKEGLIALAELLIMKATMGSNMSATYTGDPLGTLIHIRGTDDTDT